MHRMLITLALAFIQGRNPNHENNNCSIISETVEAMAIKFAVKIVRLKVCMTIANVMTLTFTEGHNCVSNLTTF